MAIEFRCSQCNQLLRVPEDSAGKNARCPKCQSLMTVPAASQPGASQPSAPFAGGGAPFSPLPPQPGAAPTPPKPADPFSFLNQPGAGGGGAMPPPPPGNPFGGSPQPVKPAGGNPFGDAGYQPTSTNPYASPLGGDTYSYRPTFPPGSRPGLPWEAKGQNFNTWMETAKLCLFSPERAYSAMRLDGGLGQPMLYCGVGLLFGVVGQMIWYIPLLVLISMFAGPGGRGGGGGEMAAMLGVQVVMQFVSGAITVVAGATIGLIIAAAIGHVCLMIVGGARQPYETTLRVLGYAHGSTAWLNVIPFVGGLVALVWMIILEVIGFSRAHDIPGGKAVLAVLLPFIACCVLFGGIILVAALAGAFANM